MASPFNAVLCALVATAFWTLLGFAVARHLLPRVLSLGAAPVFGWAIHSAAALPIFFLIGFSPLTVAGMAVLCGIVAGGSIFASAATGDAQPGPAIPLWAYPAAAALALVPAAAILPKISAGGVSLADPIYDHAKITIIDAMTRQGLPPINPVFGEFGAAGHLVYYYLWQFSAAELTLTLPVSSWEADVGLTWFTAFASLTLMMGIAVWLGKRPGAAIWVVVLAAATSLRMTLGWLFGSDGLEPFLTPSIGFCGWLFQSAWSPQHLMAASCVITAILLIARYAQRQDLALLPALVLVVVAGFESSTYVGGITFAIAASVAMLFLLAGIDPERRLRFVAGLAAAAVLALCLAMPFIRDQFSAVTARDGGSPVAVQHFEVLGAMVPTALRRILDPPAYWLVLLPIELPATYVAGILALIVLLQNTVTRPEKSAVAALACLVATGAVVSWLLASRLGDNNDLGLRAILPAAMILIAATAVAVTLTPRRALIAATAIGGLILSLPDTVAMIRSNIDGTPKPDGEIFAQSTAVWQAVRRYAAPNARVANNPQYVQDMTPWPVNLSWALLANRSSCFAGRELTLTFASLPVPRREAISEQFIRIFDGEGTPQDVSDMAKKYVCDVVVVVPQDKIWNGDPFAASPDYRLAESRDGGWRIYVLRR